MEVFPSLKTQNSRIPLSYKPYCSIDSKRKSVFNCRSNFIYWSNFRGIKGRRLGLCSSYNEAGSITQPGLENMPLSVELEPISSESQFDRVVAEAQQLEESVVVLWMASWCRKCIYLKPKLEKLAADYYPRIRFYSVDVNNVPHKLVVRAGVTTYVFSCLCIRLDKKSEQKMPTIQLWRDGKKQAEVIGGHKAYLVVNDVREMIENENGV
ncbi:UNVERIFIED_CONTAM: Thioredoxin-like 3-2, chloroplastic [Sesamum indicum]